MFYLVEKLAQRRTGEPPPSLPNAPARGLAEVVH
jgi:hypothetical protein